jgi:hypothetical protein
MRSRLGLLLVTGLVLGHVASACGPSGDGSSSEPRGDRVQETSGDEVRRQLDETPTPVTRSARDLEIDATFLDLVAAARRQDDLRDQDSSLGCLVRSSPLRLEADLAAAVRPLPEPPPSLTARLESRVVVLTRYGAIGEPSAPLGLVAFTTTRPAAGAVAQVLVVTPRALFLGRTDRQRFDEIDRSRLASLDDGTSQLFVTANAGIPVAELVSILGALPPMPGRIALAVALPEGTRLPEPAPSTAETAAICQLEPLTDEQWGELSTSSIRSAVDPLVDRARLCAGTTDGPGALGGRVVVTMRIDPSGHVSEACVSEDGTRDGVLRACLVAAARELAFPAPTGGSVDVALPLVIEPGATHRQVALCER